MPKGADKSRADLYGDDLPKVDAGAYLTAVFVDVGGGEMTWGELRDYAACTGAISEAWEFETLGAMKRAYASEYGRTDPLRVAPIERPGDYE